MGFIGIAGTIDRVDVENSMSLSMREGTTTSCLEKKCIEIDVSRKKHKPFEGCKKVEFNFFLQKQIN